MYQSTQLYHIRAMLLFSTIQQPVCLVPSTHKGQQCFHLHVSFHPHTRVNNASICVSCSIHTQRVFNGYLPTVFVTDFSILKAVLVKHFSIFSNREVKFVCVSVCCGACAYCICEDYNDHLRMIPCSPHWACWCCVKLAAKTMCSAF